MPSCPAGSEWDGGFRHLLNLGGHLPPMAGGDALTILLREGFAVDEPDTDHPATGGACVVAAGRSWSSPGTRDPTCRTP